VPGRLIVVSGTGTEIGKTHVSEALLLRWRRAGRVCGIKPIETGVAAGTEGEDARRLRLASSFHVKHPIGATFVPPLSPHLAARDAGAAISIAEIVRAVSAVRAEADGVLVELAGGLFSPLGPGVSNADLARELGGSFLLVAPDRIGVLHDVGATTRAARAFGLHAAGVLLVATSTPDESSDRNGPELAMVTDVPWLATAPRAASADLADHPSIATALRALTS
jgi:dethiobiotin synthetase